MAHVLIVDDEPEIRELLGRLLRDDGHSTDFASDGAMARRKLEEETFELVLCDVNMPGESGFELVRHVIGKHDDTAVVMVSGVDDPRLAESALELGAYGYVVKPFKFTEIPIAVANGLRRRRLELENRAHRERLEEMVLKRTSALRDAIGRLQQQEQELQRSREETIHRLARAAEFRNKETGRHIERVGRSCALVAQQLGVDPERCELMRIASPLHDIGKIGIPDRILLKPGPLDRDERSVMERHAEIGYWMLAGSGEELLDLAALLAWTHHERYDGTGYPRGLAGDDIPLEGRITAVADVFDALMSDRVYQPAQGVERAVTTMREERGRHFDPEVLDAFLDSLVGVLSIRETYPNEPDEDTYPAPLLEAAAAVFPAPLAGRGTSA